MRAVGKRGVAGGAARPTHPQVERRPPTPKSVVAPLVPFGMQRGGDREASDRRSRGGNYFVALKIGGSPFLLSIPTLFFSAHWRISNCQFRCCETSLQPLRLEKKKRPGGEKEEEKSCMCRKVFHFIGEIAFNAVNRLTQF